VNSENDLIDSSEMENHKADYSFSHGPNFVITVRVILGLFSILFWFILFNAIINLAIIGIFIALLFLIPLMYVVTSHSGVLISTHSKYFKEYTTYMGVKYGKWKSSRGLTDVAILTIRKTQRIGSSFGASGIDIENIETGVYFLIPSHRKRILIGKCKNKTEADALAIELSKSLDKNLTIFNPQVSEASKARRNR
jgi:hypothetical protein